MIQETQGQNYQKAACVTGGVGAELGLIVALHLEKKEKVPYILFYYSMRTVNVRHT